MAFAHSKNRFGINHDLVEHLKAVAELASEFAGKFDAQDLGYWAAAGRVIAVVGTDRAGRRSGAERRELTWATTSPVLEVILHFEGL